MQLTGPQLETFGVGLRNAFAFPALQQMLKFKLNRDVFDVAPVTADYQGIVFSLLDYANREGWIGKLLAAARETAPNNARLFAFAQEIGIASAKPGDLERMIVATNRFIDVDTWRSTLGQLESRVCRIEIETDRGATIYGTGFLVSDNVVMTNYHVIEIITETSDGTMTSRDYTATPSSVKCRFDYKCGHKAEVLNPGTIFGLADEWDVDLSPNCSHDQMPSDDCLDYALLRLAAAPGSAPVGGASNTGGALRGWITAPNTHPVVKPKSPLFILQHPQGTPLKLALDTQGIIGLNSNGTRIMYTTNTEPGSSGSPCFNDNWELIALHHSSDPNFDLFHKPEYNEGIPISAIMSRVRKKRLSGIL